MKKELSSAGGRRLDRKHVTHGHVLASVASNHHVKRAEAGGRLMLMNHVTVASQHQLLLQLLLLKRMKLMRLHYRAGPEARHLSTGLNAINGILKQNLSWSLLLLLLLLLRLIRLTMSNPS